MIVGPFVLPFLAGNMNLESTNPLGNSLPLVCGFNILLFDSCDPLDEETEADNEFE